MAQPKSALIICIDDPLGPQLEDTDTEELDPDDCVSTIVLVSDGFDHGRTRAHDIKCAFRKQYEVLTSRHDEYPDTLSDTIPTQHSRSGGSKFFRRCMAAFPRSRGGTRTSESSADGVKKNDLTDATPLSKDSITKAVRDSVCSMGNLVDFAVLVDRDVYETLYDKLDDKSKDSSVTKKDVVIPNHLEMPFGELQSWVMKGETLTIDSVETNV